MNNEKMVTAGLGSFVNLLEIHIFNESLKAFMKNKNKDRDWELFAPLAVHALKLPAAVKGVVDLVAGNTAKATDTGQNLVQGIVERGGAEAAGEEAVSKAVKKGIQGLNILGDVIRIGITLASFAENIAQHDDAAIADAIQFTGYTLGLIGSVFSVPVLGWVGGAVGIAAWAAKTFLFKEDTPVEIWLANGPFTRGKEYHDHFYYKRDAGTKQVKNNKGEWVETACTVHLYDDFEFLVDSDNILVGHRLRPIPGDPYYYRHPNLNFRVEEDGTIFAKANPHKDIPVDTQVAKVGEPFEMGPILQTKVKETQEESEKTEWGDPHEAYLALADAIYRPRVTLAVRNYITAKSLAADYVTLNVRIPFYIPEKSELFIDFEIQEFTRSDEHALFRTFNTAEHIKPDPKDIEDLKVGPGEYQIYRYYDPEHQCDRKFIAKVRLDLYGDKKVELPYEPLFCRSDIKTEIDKVTVKGVQKLSQVKWIVAEKTN